MGKVDDAEMELEASDRKVESELRNKKKKNKEVPGLEGFLSKDEFSKADLYGEVLGKEPKSLIASGTAKVGARVRNEKQDIENFKNKMNAKKRQ